MKDMPFVLNGLFSENDSPLACFIAYDMVKNAVLQPEFWESSLLDVEDKVNKYL